MSNRDALKHLGNVTPQTRAVAQEIADHLTSKGYKLPRYGSPYNGPVMHGKDSNPNNKEHYSGRAIDVMVMSPGAMGDEIADFVWKNRTRFGLTHVIWKQRIKSTVTQPGVWRKMADRGSGTNNHMDHPHVFLNGSGSVSGSSKTTYYQPKGVTMTVKQIQSAAGVKADGYYGGATKAAVKKLQKSLGLKGSQVDGLWGPTTEKAYKAKGKAPAKPAASKPKPSTTLLKKGSKGAAVKRLQQGLNKAFPAYSKLSVDGIFGAATEKAVKEFQRRSGLSADGIVGAKTRSALAKYGVKP